MTNEQLNAIRRTVARDATDAELAMLSHIADKYNLDPLLKEIMLIKGRVGNIIYASRDGYLKIAHSYGDEFEGMQSDVIREGDTFKRIGLEVQHDYGPKRGAIMGAWCLIYRKSKRIPFYFYAPLNEYHKGGDNWGRYPSAMIQKVAEVMCLKRAFSISGLVTQEELGIEGGVINNAGHAVQGKVEANTEALPAQVDTDKVNTPVPSDAPAAAPKEPQSQVARDPKIVIWQRYLTYYKDRDEAKDAMLAIVGNISSQDWGDEQIEALNKNMETLERKPTEEELSARKLALLETEGLRVRLTEKMQESGMGEEDIKKWLNDNFMVPVVAKMTKAKIKQAMDMLDQQEEDKNAE